MRLSNRLAVPITVAALLMGTAMSGPAWAIASPSPAPHSTRVLKPGNRIRLTVASPSAQSVVGRIVHADDTLLTINAAEQGEDLRTFARASLTRIELSVPAGSRQRGALIGAGTGTLIGLLLAVGVPDNSGSARGMALLAGPVVGAGLGALSGAGIGSAGRVERWRTVPLDTRMGLSGDADHLRLEGSIRWSF